MVLSSTAESTALSCSMARRRRRHRWTPLLCSGAPQPATCQTPPRASLAEGGGGGLEGHRAAPLQGADTGWKGLREARRGQAKICTHTSHPKGSRHSPNLVWAPANRYSRQAQKPSSDLPFKGSRHTQSTFPPVSRKKPKVILPSGSEAKGRNACGPPPPTPHRHCWKCWEGVRAERATLAWV